MVVVPVVGMLVAPAGTLLVPPAGVVLVPPAELLPAVDGPTDETPLLRLIPGLPTALGLLNVPPVVPLLTFEFPAVLVLFVPATVPVGTAVVR